MSLARQGREKQRYGEDGERLVAGCVVLREVVPSAPPDLDSAGPVAGGEPALCAPKIRAAHHSRWAPACSATPRSRELKRHGAWSPPRAHDLCCLPQVAFITQRVTRRCGQGADGARECLLISSKDPSLWIFPKGGWETDETLEEAACRETLEEAGVIVELGRQIGWFTCDGKSGMQTRVCLFEASSLQHLSEGWGDAKGEKGTRIREWMSLADAKQVCKYPYMRQVLEDL